MGLKDITTCPDCDETVRFERLNAGFGNQGFMYGEIGSDVLIWDSYGPGYTKVVAHTHPMLSEEQQHLVEQAIRPGLVGEPHRFANLPRCPNCEAMLPALFDASRTYFVIIGQRIDAEADRAWR